jgi:hypothetical protein
LLDPPKPRAGRETTPAFNVSPETRAGLRQYLVDKKDAEGLAAFDKQYGVPSSGTGRGNMPASAYQRPDVQGPALQEGESPLLNLARHVVGSVAGPVAGGIAGLASLPFVGAEKAAQNVQDVQGALSYTPPAGTQSAAMVDVFNSPYNPLTWIPRGAAAVGDRAGSALADVGLPAAGAVVNGAVQATPMALGLPRVAGAVGRGIGAVADAVRPLPAPLEVAARIEPPLKKQFVLRDGKIVPKEVVSAPEAAIVGETRTGAAPVETAGTMDRQVVGGGAASASTNPYPKLSGQQLVRGGEFPQIKLSNTSGDLALPEQSVRAGILSRIMREGDGDPSSLRKGAVSGNEDTLRTEATLARAANPTPQGIMLRDKFAQEQRALGRYAEKIVEKTGASQTLLDNGSRGELMNSALYGPDSLRSFLQQTKQALYDEAAARQGPNPVDLPTLDKMVSSPQLTSSLKIAGQPNMLPGVQELIQQFRKNGFENPVTGELIPPNTVAAAMELHKALNGAWTPENSLYIGRMKRAILDDVTKAGGADLYQRANAVHAAEKTLMDAPGMKKIFGEVDPVTGISKGTSPEKILDRLNTLPDNQYAHIFNVFEDMARGRVPGAPDLELPAGFRDMGAQATKEMAGALARGVQQAGADKAGVWNANSANKALNAYTNKLKLAASPDVIQDLHTLNAGGYMMPGMHAYEGAALQVRRLGEAGMIERNLERAGAVSGSMTRIPGAEYVGGKVGALLQKKVETNRLNKSAAETQAEMQEAAKLGRLSDLGK